MTRINDDFDGEPLAKFMARYSPVGPMPVDACIAMQNSNQRRPGILAPRADQDEEE